jgi:hypothetical protein
MLIENNRKERPEDWLERRKWRKFLESVPRDGVGHSYFVARRDDIPTIRVRAAQLNKDAAEKYSVTFNLDVSVVTVTIKPNENGNK